MSFNNNPAFDPANNGSLAGTLQFAVNKILQQTDGMLPAKVIAYDRDTNRAQVELLITLVTTDGSQVPRPQIASIPALILGAGGFILSFPIKTGSLGWVWANDRDISFFLKNYAQSPPNTGRIKNFSDGLFIPDAMRGYSIAPGDADNAVLQSLDGTVVISISPTQITLTAPTTVVNGAFVVNGVSTFTGNTGITGTLAVVGDITATGSITPNV